jgi:Transcriptional regulator, AbiEi antitoxin, Type IV TA system/Transcriptional regulator, AbiEi antitoxin N-terminal domain
MGEQTPSKLNLLEKKLPEGLLVDAAWLEKRGYYGSLRKKYVDLGWLEQPAHRVYRRPRGVLRWEQVVISLQTLLSVPVVVGGRTALELQGFAHYLAREQAEVHLYGYQAPPSWLHKLPLSARFVFHKGDRLFRNDPITRGLTSLSWKLKTGEGISADPLQAGLTTQPWGQFDWPLTHSTPERALLELLDELPDRESFHQADKLMEGLPSLSPRRLQKLLEDCKSVKVKRLFFFFADRHGHAWLKRLDRSRIDLGKGKRMLVRGGKLDPAYQITVPGDLNAAE